MLASFLSGKYLSHIPCWFHFYRGSFSYTSRAGFIFISGVFLIPCWLHFYVGSFSYTSRDGFIFILGVFLTRPMLALLFCGEFLLHIPWWLPFLIWGVSLTHPVLFSFLSAKSHLNIPCCFICIWGVSLTHPILTLFLCGEFLLHNLCWLPFYLGSFSYTSHAGVNFIWGVSLTHPVLASLLCGEFLLHIPRFILCRNFLLHIPCCLHIYKGDFSYTSQAAFIFI